MSTDTETGKAIAQRVIDRARARRVPIDTDRAYFVLVEEWIRGEIDMKAMRERYLDMIALQAAERRGPPKSRLGTTPLELSDEANEEQKKWACEKPRPMKCGDLNLQRGTAAATELGGDRHLHQLKALCLIFDQ